MFSIVLTCLSTYYLSALVQTLGHRLFGHTRRVATIHTGHALGHHAAYPVGRLLRQRWISSERHVLWYYAPPLLAIALVLALVVPAEVLLSYGLTLLASVALHVYLHRQYHLDGAWLERFRWFRRKRALHFLHHQQVRRNYAIIEFWIDRLVGTYRAPDGAVP